MRWYLSQDVVEAFAARCDHECVASIPAIRLLWCLRTMTFSLRAVTGVTLWLELVIGRDLSLPIDLSAICNICAIDASADQ